MIVILVLFFKVKMSMTSILLFEQRSMPFFALDAIEIELNLSMFSCFLRGLQVLDTKILCLHNYISINRLYLC